MHASISPTTTGTETKAVRFRTFVQAHRDRAVSIAWRLLDDPSAAEDVAQEAFAQAWRGLDGFQDAAKLSTWFYRILVRQAWAHRRRRTARRVWQQLTGQEPSSKPTGDVGLRTRISAAMDTLSRGQREAFVLVHLEGFTVVEAAASLGRSTGTLKSHLHRARTRLRLELADLERSTP